MGLEQYIADIANSDYKIDHLRFCCSWRTKLSCNFWPPVISIRFFLFQEKDTTDDQDDDSDVDDAENDSASEKRFAHFQEQRAFK